MSTTSELCNYIHACLPNVTGVGHGYKVTGGKQTDKFGLIITVKKKLPKYMLSPKALIPEEIDGEVTDVIEADFQALPLLTEEMPRVMGEAGTRTGKNRRAPGGVSVGHPLITAGTLGGWLYHGSDVVMLSNNHVLANKNAAEIGDPIYQPGVYDGGTSADTIAHLTAFHKIDFAGGDNVVDAAIAKVINIADVDWQTLGITTVPIAYKVAPTVGMPVTKSGRTTGVTKGQISSTDWSGYVGYGGGRTAFYINQIRISTIGFIAGGDSGSWLLQDKETTPDTIIGLCFAGTQDGQAIANPIIPVFEALGIELTLPATLEGYVYLNGGIITGAYVVGLDPAGGKLSIASSDSNGKYSLPDVSYIYRMMILASHYEYEGKVYQGCYWKKIISDPDTQDINLEEYDAVSNGLQMNFKFLGGVGWHELDLLLEQYKSVWN